MKIKIQGMGKLGRWPVLLVVSLLSVDRSSAQTPLVSGISKPLLGGCTQAPTHGCTACRSGTTGPCQCGSLPQSAPNQCTEKVAGKCEGVAIDCGPTCNCFGCGSTTALPPLGTTCGPADATCGPAAGTPGHSCYTNCASFLYICLR